MMDRESPPDTELDSLTARLEASGDYRVLRRLRALGPSTAPTPEGVRIGLILDVETTGTDLQRDEVIEVRFAYTPEGEILGVEATFEAFNEPSKPISVEITALTGIDDAMVAGHRLDLEVLGAFVAPAVIVLAHNAAFDRRFAERLHRISRPRPGAAPCPSRPGPRRASKAASSLTSPPTLASSTTATAPFPTASPPWSCCAVPCPVPA